MLKQNLIGLIYVRNTENWINIKKHNPPHNLTYLNDRKRECLIKNIKLWDSHCSVSYCEYRHFLKELAVHSWNQTGMEVITKLPKNIDNIIIFPTDDDDWLSPTIFNEIKNCKNNLIFWDCWMYFMSKQLLSYGGHIFVPLPKEFKWTGSNGYALQGEIIKKAVMEHTETKKLYKNNIEYVKKSLSVWVHHPASTFTLSNKIIHPAILLENLFYPQEISEEFSWAKPLFDKLYHFTKSIRFGCKMF